MGRHPTAQLFRIPCSPQCPDCGKGRIRGGLGRIGGESRSSVGWRRVVLGEWDWLDPPRDALDGPRNDTLSRLLEWCSRPDCFLPHPHVCRPQVQHSCRPTSAPMLNRFYLFHIPFFSSSIPPWATPRGPIALPDRRPPSCQPFVLDFHPLIPALRDRRLHGRLGG